MREREKGEGIEAERRKGTCSRVEVTSRIVQCRYIYIGEGRK